MGDERVSRRSAKGVSNTVMATWMEYAQVGRVARTQIENATIPLHVIDTVTGAYEATVPKAVSQLMPSAKAIFILGAPWEYAVSEWLRKCRVMCNNPALACTVEKFKSALFHKEPSVRSAMRSMDYSRYLDRWFEDFNPNAMLIVLQGHRDPISLITSAAARMGSFIHGVGKNGAQASRPTTTDNINLRRQKV